ncbi:hypothetical protein V7S43_009232 [Phytophthora oleae]|uniref:Uncharacterized protein n=1 Tax=Phytophthora oleae TaxID=2107226 RepID=A0ABD3FHJ9_9STRA
MAAAIEADAASTRAGSAAKTASPGGPQPSSSSQDADVSTNVSAVTKLPVDASDEEEVTTAEFSVDLADGQTWAINFYECAAEGDLECLEEILDSGRVGVNDVDVDGFTALMVAAAEGHRGVVQALLRRGADVGGRTHELRSTALHFAAKNGDAEIVAALCECDLAVVDCWNVNADTPLIWACIEGRAEAVKVLLKHGADVNMLNQYGASTLLCAVMIGEDPEQDAESDKRRAEIVTMLLEKNGKLVNFQDREGSTAMHLAASCGYLECVKILLSFGADITLRNAIGQTALEEAQDSELRESGSCVEHLRGIWRQLEEEAAARMMAMLEMEEEAATGVSTAASTSSGKKSKKKNKKAKRKAAKQLQQQLQESEQDSIQTSSTQDESSSKNDEPTKAEPTTDHGTASETAGAVEAKDDEASSDDEEDSPVRDSMVSIEQDSGDEVEDTLEPEATQTTKDEQSTEAVDTTPSAGAWTTVGKKHRSSVSTVTSNEAKVPASSPKEKIRARRTSTTSPPKPSPQRKFSQRSSNSRNSTSGRAHPLTAPPVAHTSNRAQEERWEKTSGFTTTSRTARSIASSLNPNALAFRSLGLATGVSNSLNASSPATATGSSGLSFSSASPWRPSFGPSAAMAPYTSAMSSLSSTGLHYWSGGRLTWKQQRANGNHQLARETRDRWVNKLRLSNENVTETLSYLACGLCGELVNDNLQCSGGTAEIADEKTSSPCTQLYCASCLESSAFRTADSTTFKCVRCHEVIAKESMTRNSLAQAQAASLGLSMSSSTSTKVQEDSIRYSLANMQHIFEDSESRASAVDLQAFYLVPGSDLSSLCNGQLEVLESAHQRALSQIVEQRIANARALERLQMEEWLKMQRDVLQFAPAESR